MAVAAMTMNSYKLKVRAREQVRLVQQRVREGGDTCDAEMRCTGSFPCLKLKPFCSAVAIEAVLLSERAKVIVVSDTVCAACIYVKLIVYSGRV